MYLKGVLIGVLGIILGILLLEFRDYLKRKRIAEKRKRKKKTKKLEFSKFVLALVLSTYFLGIYVGYKTVELDFSQLSVFLMYIGTPTTIAIGFYSWKAKAENIIKIKHENSKETEGISVDLNNITP